MRHLGWGRPERRPFLHQRQRRRRHQAAVDGAVVYADATADRRAPVAAPPVQVCHRQRRLPPRRVRRLHSRPAVPRSAAAVAAVSSASAACSRRGHAGRPEPQQLRPRQMGLHPVRWARPHPQPKRHFPKRRFRLRRPDAVRAAAGVADDGGAVAPRARPRMKRPSSRPPRVAGCFPHYFPLGRRRLPPVSKRWDRARSGPEPSSSVPDSTARSKPREAPVLGGQTARRTSRAGRVMFSPTGPAQSQRLLLQSGKAVAVEIGLPGGKLFLG